MKNPEQLKNFLISQGWEVETTNKDEFGHVITLLIDPKTKALFMFHPVTGVEFHQHAKVEKEEVQIIVCVTAITLQIYANGKLIGEAPFSMQDELLTEFFGVPVKSKLHPNGELHCKMPHMLLIVSAFYID